MAVILGVQFHSREKKILFTVCLVHMLDHMENAGCQGGSCPQEVG